MHKVIDDELKTKKSEECDSHNSNMVKIISFHIEILHLEFESIRRKNLKDNKNEFKFNKLILYIYLN